MKQHQRLNHRSLMPPWHPRSSDFITITLWYPKFALDFPWIPFGEKGHLDGVKNFRRMRFLFHGWLGSYHGHHHYPFSRNLVSPSFITFTPSFFIATFTLLPWQDEAAATILKCENYFSKLPKPPEIPRNFDTFTTSRQNLPCESFIKRRQVS